MKIFAVPGLYASMAIAALTALGQYFTSGAGVDSIYAPIVVAVVLVATKAITVQFGGGEEPSTRAIGGEPPRSKWDKFLRG